MGETITPVTATAESLKQGIGVAVSHLPEPVRRTSGSDLLAGFTNAIANVPDSMANAALAGVSPIHGLYALVVGTPVAALTTSSRLMTVAVTGAMALIVGDTLADVAADERAGLLIALALLVGILQIAFGLLRAGTLLRFVSNSVMRGFLTGVAVNIVIGQAANLTGFASERGGKVARLADTVVHPSGWQFATVAVALLTAAIILSVERTPARRFSFPIALVLSTLVVYAVPVTTRLVGDTSPIPSALPKLVLPSAGSLQGMLVPAVAVAIVGLIQGAGISRSVPNPDGTYPSMNRDFMGQGLGNVASALFGGMPVGASISSTALNVQLGGRRRTANFMIGPVIALILLVAAPAVEQIPLAALGTMLVFIGVRAIDIPAIRAVWNTSLPTRAIMATTFVATLIVPLQYAVMIGVALSVVQHVYKSSLDVRVVSLALNDQSRWVEGDPPAQLPSDSVTVLDIYGSVFYAGADVINRLLPDVADARRAVAVLRLRGRADVGSTFLGLIQRYASEVEAGGGYLALVGIGPALLDQLVRTGVAERLGEAHIYLAKPALQASLEEAVRDAEAWLGQGERGGRSANAQPQDAGSTPV